MKQQPCLRRHWIWLAAVHPTSVPTIHRISPIYILIWWSQPSLCLLYSERGQMNGSDIVL